MGGQGRGGVLVEGLGGDRAFYGFVGEEFLGD